MRFVLISILSISSCFGSASPPQLIRGLLRSEGFTQEQWVGFWGRHVVQGYLSSSSVLRQLGETIPIEVRDIFASRLQMAFDRLDLNVEEPVSEPRHTGVGDREKARPYSYLFFQTAYNLYVEREEEFWESPEALAFILTELLRVSSYRECYACDVDQTTYQTFGIFDWTAQVEGNQVQGFTEALVTAFAADACLAAPHADPAMYTILYSAMHSEFSVSPANARIFVCMFRKTRLPTHTEYVEFRRVRNWLYHKGQTGVEVCGVECEAPASLQDCSLLQNAA